MAIGIEDFCEDIVGKAMRGTGTSDTDLAAVAGVEVQAIQRLRRGEGDAETAGAIASPLGLDPGKLVDSLNRAWYPEAHAVDGLYMVNTAFGDMFVNAFTCDRRSFASAPVSKRAPSLEAVSQTR